jgi:hypothetical protein
MSIFRLNGLFECEVYANINATYIDSVYKGQAVGLSNDKTITLEFDPKQQLLARL